MLIKIQTKSKYSDCIPLAHWLISILAHYSFTIFLSNSSSDTPFVSGTLVNTHINCNTIINAKKAKMGQGPISLKMPLSLSKKTGVIKVMIAANTQCTLAPKDCPTARTLLGEISAMKTQMTAPCPIACAAINNNRNTISNPALACA
jgi:hypothetical protein